MNFITLVTLLSLVAGTSFAADHPCPVCSCPTTTTTTLVPPTTSTTTTTQVQNSTYHYVSPTGLASNDGSRAKPWDLQTALSHPASVKPGDTIWLMGGVYTHLPQGVVAGNPGYNFISQLKGTIAAPIVVKASPSEAVLIDGGAYGGPIFGPSATGRPVISIYGAYTWFQDLEIASTSTEKRLSAADLSFPTDLTRPDGPNVYGVGIKLINLVIHDVTTGISAWGPGGDFEAYGNVVYNNGWQGTPHTHGHNVYTQNYVTSGLKTYQNNIFLNCFQENTQAYGSSAATIAHMRFLENVYLNRPVLIGGRTNATLLDDQFSNNYLYGVEVALQYSPGPNYQDVIADSNYIVEGRIQAGSWKSAQITNNTIVSVKVNGVADWVPTPVGIAAPAWNWNKNAYFGVQNQNGMFAVEGEGFMGLSKWQTRTGFDKLSTFTPGTPTVNKIVLLPNKYDPNRAIVVLYNWQKSASIPVDLTKLGWKIGDSVDIHGAQDYKGDIKTVVLTNQVFTFDMQTPRSIALPYGWTTALGAQTFPLFGAFVLVRK